MPSWQMRAVATYVRLTRKRRYATEEAGVAFLHSTKGPSAPPRGPWAGASSPRAR